MEKEIKISSGFLILLMVTLLVYFFSSQKSNKDQQSSRSTVNQNIKVERGRDIVETIKKEDSGFSQKKDKEEFNTFNTSHLNIFSYWQRLFETDIPHGYVNRVIRHIEKKSVPLNPDVEPFKVDYSFGRTRNTKAISEELNRLSKLGIFWGVTPTTENSMCHIARGYCFVFPYVESQHEFMRKGVAIRLKDRAMIKWSLDE